jgi:hypothetical protein
MNDVTELGTITVAGVTFRKRDNGPQIFYDYETGELYWVILQPKITDPVLPGQKPPDDGRCHIPYWVAYVWKGESVCNLNLRCGQLGGTWVKDPFHDLTDSGYDDPPIKLLTAIAELIANDVDPWTLPKIIEKGGDP